MYVQVITKLTGMDSEPNLALSSKKEQEDLLRQVTTLYIHSHACRKIELKAYIFYISDTYC